MPSPAVYIVFEHEDDKEAAELIAMYRGTLNPIIGPLWLNRHGDVNGDGVIDGKDRSVMMLAYRDPEGATKYPQCDLNGDGVVDDADLAILDYWYERGAKVAVVGEDAKLMENDLIVVGGYRANPYTEEYFYKTGLVTDDGTKLIGEGVYADGKRYIKTIERDNGTVVTAVFGLSKDDTYYTAKDFVVSTPINLKMIGGIIGVVSITSLAGYALVRGKAVLS